MKKCKLIYLLLVMMICTVLCSCDVDAPEDVYQELLGDIYNLILMNGQETELANYALNGIIDAKDYRTSEEPLNYAGYAFQDLNEDGMPELIIGGIDEEKNKAFWGHEIYAVYTCVQGEIYCICSGWSRNCVSWMGENVFCNLGSGGAAYTILARYELLPNAVEWDCIEMYFTDENGIYYNQTGIYDNKYAEKLDMTREEFWQLIDEFYDNVLEFELTPFSAYTH